MSRCLISVVVVAVCWPTVPALGRTWTSADGGFRVDAELVETRADGTLLLRRGDGQLVQIPVGKLSAADQQFVRGLPGANGQQPPQQHPSSQPTAATPPLLRGTRPVPNADVAAAKVKELRELLKADFQQAQGNSQSRRELCGRLMGLAREALANDPVGAYAMAGEAAAVAAEGGDVAEALSSITWLAEQFAISDATARKSEVVKKINIDSLPADALPNVVAQLLTLMTEAQDAADYDLTIEIGRVAARAARKSHDKVLISDVQTRGKSLKDQQEIYKAAAAAKSLLEKTPQDKDANLSLGRFQALVRGKWDTGLPRLAAGSDAELAALAKHDLAAPTTAGEQLAVADAWWKLSESPAGAGLPELKQRAAHWYQQAVPQLVSLDKIRAEKRVAEVQDKSVDAKVQQRSTKVADTFHPKNREFKQPSEIIPDIVARGTYRAIPGNNVRDFTLFSNGKVGSPTGNATWSRKGNILTLRFPTSAAVPGNMWVDSLVIGKDGSLKGGNQVGVKLVGTIQWLK